jgi:hypothetical protein
MADTFTSQGTFRVTPLNVGDAGEVDVSLQTGASFTAKSKTTLRYELLSDGPVSVGLAGLSAAHAVYVKVSGGYAAVSLTVNGTAAVLYPDPSGQLEYVSRAMPVTAISVQRQAATPVVVRVTLVEAT